MFFVCLFVCFVFVFVFKGKVLFSVGCFFFSFSLIKFTYLFIFGCAGSSLGHADFLSSCGVQASHCGGFSCCGAQALGAWASVVVAHGLSSCGTWAQ